MLFVTAKQFMLILVAKTTQPSEPVIFVVIVGLLDSNTSKFRLYGAKHQREKTEAMGFS